MKPYYVDKLITLYNADFRDVSIELLAGADAVITDPPYQTTNLKWDRWPVGWSTIASMIAPQLWCFGSMKMFMQYGHEFDHHWKLAQDIVWEKHNGSNSHADRFRRTHEIALHFYQGEWKKLYISPQFTNDAQRRRVHRKMKPAHWNDIGKAHYETEEGGPRMMTSVIFAPSCHGVAVNETQKPESIIEPLIEYSVPPSGLVVDCFAGSGTTLAVARRTGRRAIGIEIRESQCEEIAKRLSQELLYV